MSWDWNQALKGAGGGALAGGSLGGPYGAAIGGGIGLLSGLFGAGGGEQQDRLQQEYERLRHMSAPQAGPAAQSAYSGFRDNQRGLVSRLEAMANGQGPSLARQQFEQATDRNVRSQQAIAASGRGGPLAALTAANNTAMLGANAAQGSALARTNEQMQAIGQLGGVIAQGRGADEQTNMFNAGQQNEVALANLTARLKAMGISQEAINNILQQMGGNQGQPGFGDQVLAGGAGMFALGAGQRAQARASAPTSAIAQNSTINPFGPSTTPGRQNTINPFSQPYNPMNNPQYHG